MGKGGELEGEVWFGGIDWKLTSKIYISKVAYKFLHTTMALVKDQGGFSKMRGNAGVYIRRIGRVANLMRCVALCCTSILLNRQGLEEFSLVGAERF